MHFVWLFLALILPPALGVIWLAAARGALGQRPLNGPLLLGYGSLLGLAVLYAVLQLVNVLDGSITYLPVMGVLVLLALAGLYVLRRNPGGWQRPGYSWRGRWEKLAALAVLLAIALHLLSVLLELVHLPVYPWDAWLSWMYRAKAWFLSGAVQPMDAPQDWLGRSSGALYNVAGNHYPDFLPLLSLWAATAWGGWHESVVNYPLLLCALGLVAGLYGQCRQRQLSPLLSLLLCYFLLSVPLVETHLTLAGQADIWLAGFTGLGFVALLAGALAADRFQVGLGLLLVAFGALVKLEGAVWLAAALGMLLLGYRPRLVLVLLGALLLLAALCFATGMTYVELPGLGGAGFRDGVLYLPGVGATALEFRGLLDDYWENFFLSGGWHLFWLFQLLALAAILLLPRSRDKALLLAFYASVGLCIVGLFQFTEAGRWADDWTAINRLPLHFAAPLLFVPGILLGRLDWRTPGRPQLRWAALGLGLTLGGMAVYLYLATADSAAGQSRRFSAADFRFVVGDGEIAEGRATVRSYQNNVAILSSGTVYLNADQFASARVVLAGDSRSEPGFFWRRGGEDDGLRYTWLPGAREHWIDLAAARQWHGTVSEIGIIFYRDDDREFVFEGLELGPWTLSRQLAQHAYAWFRPGYWSQGSVHFLARSGADSALPYILPVLAWGLLTLALTMCFARRRREALLGVLLCLLLGWLLLDLRWAANRVAQVQRTAADYSLASDGYLALEGDRLTYGLVSELRGHLAPPPARVLIVAEDPEMRFEMFRAKYHLLPAAGYVHEGPLDTAPLARFDQLLLLRRQRAPSDYAPLAAADLAARIVGRHRDSAVVVAETRRGFLLDLPRRGRLARGERGE